MPKPTVRAALHEAEDESTRLREEVRRLRQEQAEAEFDRARPEDEDDDGAIPEDAVWIETGIDADDQATKLINDMSAYRAMKLAEAIMARIAANNAAAKSKSAPAAEGKVVRKRLSN